MRRKAQKNPASTYFVLGLIVVVAIAVVVVLVMSSTPRTAPTSEFGPDPSIPRGLTADGLPYLGSENAPVTMRIYEDLGCHNCRDFFRDTEPFILEQFIMTGKVKLEIYTLAFVNQKSLPGAEAAKCALDQGKFWEYREVLFVNQDTSLFTRTDLLGWAEALNLNRADFARCYDREVHKQAILEQSQRAVAIGVNGTPTTEIRGQRHVGVIAFEGVSGMKQILETALAETDG